MFDRIRPRLTYANVLSTFAAFGVLAGGGAYAASKIGASDIAKNAVRAKHVKNGALSDKDLSKKAIRRIRSLDIIVRSGPLTVPAGSGFNSTKQCQPGEIAIGGGTGPSNGFMGNGRISTSVPANRATGLPTASGGTPTAWNVVFLNEGDEIDHTISVVCLRP